ncbi:MAG TPA: DUF6056 family protein [Chloroflexota bacterium]
MGMAGLGLALAAVLAAYGLRGWFARYTADDYCTAGIERAAGFVAAQVYWYQSWSGRFSYYAVVSLVEFAGTGVVQILPAMALIGFVVAGAWAVLPVARAQGWPEPRLASALLGGAIVLACLQGAPNLEQALYWQTGMLTYLLPLVLLTLYAGWLVRRLRAGGGPSPAALLASCLLLFVCAGLSETSLGVQLALLGLATLMAAMFVHARDRRPLVTLLASGFVTTVIAAVIVVAAPGNYVHEATLTGSVHPISELPTALRASVDFAGLFARAVEFRARLAVLVVVGLSLWFGFRGGQANRPPTGRAEWMRRGLLLVASLASTWLVLLAATTPGYFAQLWDPPERAQFDAVWVVVVGMATVAYELGELTAQVSRRLGAPTDHPAVAPVLSLGLLLLGIGCLMRIPTVLSPLATDMAYAAEWDAFDAMLRVAAAAGQPLVVQGSLPRHYDFDFITPDPGLYPNPCVAMFYGVPSIRVAQ